MSCWLHFKYGLMRWRNPISFANFLHNPSIWWLNERSWSNITPKSLKWVTCSMFLPFKLTSIVVEVTRFHKHFPVTSMDLVFRELIDILFCADHSSKRMRSWFGARVRWGTFSLLVVFDEVVSSAKTSSGESLICIGMSFTNNRKRIGPKIDP